MRIRIVFKSELIANQYSCSICQIIHYGSIDELRSIFEKISDRLSIESRLGIEVKLFSESKYDKDLKFTAKTFDDIVSVAQLWQDHPDKMIMRTSMDSLIRIYHDVEGNQTCRDHGSDIIWSHDELPDPEDVSRIEYSNNLLKIHTMLGTILEYNTTAGLMVID